ncbi:transposase [Streptomyces sp. NPDC058108]|uniref:transposase n=1 Tax=Streptomyces sp. NPDC058108 TaxID=3346344 RepID=UPI0036E54E12
MSLRVVGLGEIPAETARVARVVCPRGAFAMRLREELAEVFSGQALADLYPERGRPAVAPGVLALVTVLQFAESLSDRQAAEAERTRIDWKYAIGRELTDTGFDYSVLSEFRSRLLDGGKAGEVFDLYRPRERSAMGRYVPQGGRACPYPVHQPSPPLTDLPPRTLRFTRVQPIRTPARALGLPRTPSHREQPA